MSFSLAALVPGLPHGGDGVWLNGLEQRKESALYG